MVRETVPPRSDAVQLAGLLDSPEIAQLISELAAMRWTGRPGYPIRTMVGMALTKSLYALPTWTRTVALVSEHAALHEQLPDLGATVAIDASDLPAYANGQRYLYKGGPERKTYSDPDASWGHRSALSTRAAGGFYGYKLHQAVDAETGCRCLAGRDGQGSRVQLRRSAAGIGQGAGVPARDRRHGHGL